MGDTWIQWKVDVRMSVLYCEGVQLKVDLAGIREGGETEWMLCKGSIKFDRGVNIW